MGKNVIFAVLFAVAAVFASDYTGHCAPALGAVVNGEHIPGEPTFFKSICPTREELGKGVERYLEATNQAHRAYIIVEQEQWFVLHFTD